MTHNKASGSEGLSDEQILRLWDTHVAYETGGSAKQPPLGNKDKLAFARAVLAASPAPLSEGAWVKEPSVTDMQFRLIDAKNALQHAADTAAPEVAKVYRQRASEVAVVISALSAASTPSGSEGAGTTPQDQAIFDKVADRYQRERTSSVAAASSMNQNEKHGTGGDASRGGEHG